ncbi:MAG: glycosyltransferase [Bacteroidota bacterium]|nr:glycosyltransferase [Bacteroidota bacterium]
MTEKKNILISPLNWGLGHASRIVPIIYYFKKRNYNVILAADTHIINFLKLEFPEIQHVFLPSYKVKFSKRKSQILVFLSLIPKILYYTIKEHFLLKEIIDKYNIDIVISDNRYGLWSKKAKSIFITHQLMIKLPLVFKIFEYPVHLFLRLLISPFDKCWVPDFANYKNLSGDLSHKYSISSNVKFIGPLSRFKDNKEHKTNGNKYDILCILSGPEPQRTIFENILIKQLSNIEKSVVIVRGTNVVLPYKNRITNNIKFFDICSSVELKNLIINAGIVICRSGYSSIMDLTALNKKAVLVPTPGQTEQEYLAKRLQKQKCYYSMSQKDFSIDSALKNYQKYSCNNNFYSQELFIDVLGKTDFCFFLSNTELLSGKRK